ncbi:MAG: glucose-1-phosphate thymidylyltransferase [Chloroflexi bacterium]|nr:MAG: glucose-1-phosphate thymidylyltransferase [Chloroflexota bacterium]
MKGLILSGGKGTRLYPLTYTRAKQLIPVANKPILVRVIESIRDAGIHDIGVVIGETGPEVREALGDGKQWGVNIVYIPQDSPDGLAHAVKISRDFLGDDRFVMFLGDNVIEGGVDHLVDEFSRNNWNSQIVLKEVENASAYGVAKLRDDGSIEQLIEKPPHPPSNLALVGIYMFDHHIFEAVNAIQPSARGELEITDAIQWLIDQDYAVFPHVHQGWWIDTGKPTDMLEANSYVLDELLTDMPVEARVSPDATISSDSQIDSRVIVERGAQIVDSVIRGPAIIGEDTVVENSYIGPFSSLYHHVTIENCEIERCIILEHSTISDLGIRLADSLIGRHVTLKRGDKKPAALRMNLGDHSRVWVI